MCIYIYIHIYIYIYSCCVRFDRFAFRFYRFAVLPFYVLIALPLYVLPLGGRATPSPPTKSSGFGGFDSSRLLILRGGNSHVR